MFNDYYGSQIGSHSKYRTIHNKKSANYRCGGWPVQMS